MEKFALDLNKVLDEYSYINEDQVEQAAAVSVPPNYVGLPLHSGVTNVFQQPVLSANSDYEITKIIDGTHVSTGAGNIVEQQEGPSSDLGSLRNTEILTGNFNPINHFYTHESLIDDKLQQKQCLGMEGAESSLAIHSDISQNFLQKSLNDNAINSYDGKINQPSVSNVFSSYNDYIGAPGVNLVNLDSANESSRTLESRQNDKMIDVTDSFKQSTVKSNDHVEKCTIDDLLTVGEEDLIDERKDHSVVPPNYQNILLPIKLDPCTPEKPKEPTVLKLGPDLRFPDLITENNVTNVSSQPEKIVKSILDEPEHVYENVYIGTDIPKTQEIYPTGNKIKINDPEIAHTYENVDFGAQSASSTNKKDGVYECIYISSKDNLPETNTELEIAAKKMIDQFNLKEPEAQAVCTNSMANSAASTNLVFQTVKIDTPQFIPQEPKPVIGFTTIDDMSEEELNKYLADLEAEERANERASAVYQNIPVNSILDGLKPNSSSTQQDEDANEAPIFEAVTIGELPQVPHEHLQEKAKKFPVIDYSMGNAAGETSREFSCAKKIPELSRINAQVKEDATKIRKSKKTHEKVRKSSDNTEPVFHGFGHQNEIRDNEEGEAEKDKENGNYVSGNATTDDKSKLDTPKFGSEENKNLNSAENNSSQFDSIDNDLENTLQNINSSDDNLSNFKTPIRNTETISRFSVTRNVDVNDKLGDSRYKPSHSQNKSKNTLEDNSEYTESSDDPNRPMRPQTLDVVSSVDMSDTAGSSNQEASDAEGDRDSGRAPSPDVSENSSMESGSVLGKQPPFWVPDADAPNCMLCDLKFTVMKRRHHCRACGKVFCSKCCNIKYRLEYQSNVESRICVSCHQLLTKAESDTGSEDYVGFSNSSTAGINSPQVRQPNPNNPMEYCSTIPPLQQLAGGLPPPPTVMVPVGVLKREGSSKPRSDGPKSVMFSDGIRPGCDLTELDTTWDWKPPVIRKMGNRRTGGGSGGFAASSASKKPNCPPIDPVTNSYIPQDPAALPPTVTIHKGQTTYHEVTDVSTLHTSLKNECEPPVMFAINRNLYACVKIIDLNCCVNRICWNVTSKGLACVGQDEVVFLVETMPDETEVPKDLLIHINQIYHEATKGNTISEYGMSLHQNGNLLGSREHAGFIFVRQTLQCLQKVIVPPAPFLVGLLVHRWETPWAKVFPLRLVLRLGAEYRYYPCPLVSVRFRDAVYFEIGHTIMKLLADFRNFAYTLPKVQGLTIHMQDRTTNVRFPKNRYNQVIKGLNNSNDHVLAFASNFSIQADSHLVCMQSNSDVESTYQTQAINIQDKPRKVTGASFIVINGALKSSMGLSANSSIVEDGLMVQIMPEKMEALKAALKNMQDFTIGCGRQGAAEPDEIVNFKWVENDSQFNLNIKSPIDGRPMDGVPSIRVHNGINFVGASRFIRWTEVFIIKSDDDQPFGIHYPVDINKLSESIARATCAALVKLLDLLANAGLTKIAVRTTISPDNVGYEAGSEGTRLPPIYMNSLDNELIQVLQKAVQGCEDTQTVLELIFYVLETET